MCIATARLKFKKKIAIVYVTLPVQQNIIADNHPPYKKPLASNVLLNLLNNYLNKTSFNKNSTKINNAEAHIFAGEDTIHTELLNVPRVQLLFYTYYNGVSGEGICARGRSFRTVQFIGACASHALMLWKYTSNEFVICFAKRALLGFRFVNLQSVIYR